MEVFRSMIIDAPIETVWEAVRPFDALEKWHPMIAASRMENASAFEVGGVRRMELGDGGVIREKLLAHSDLDNSYTYTILESPLPIRDYVSTHSLIEISHSNQTLSLWEGSCDCDPGDVAAMEKLIGDAIYIGGMKSLSEKLKVA